MGESKMRPETKSADRGDYCPTNGTAYLMIYNAVKSKEVLIAGQLHSHGESCALGSFWDVNPKCSLQVPLIDEVAAVNDSFKGSAKQRRLMVLRWLRWKLNQAGMPGFEKAAKP